MTNIWGFLSQTVEVTIVVAVVVFLKLLFRDKLSARWQYGIWSVFLLAVLWPAGCSGRFVLRTPQVWLQAAKTLVETDLASRYTQAESVVYNTSFLPYITGRPASITDALFAVYIAGVVLCIVRYMVSYMRLGRIISRSGYSDSLQQQTDGVRKNYGLKSVKVRRAAGLPSAFVYGLFRPVLILPAQQSTDDKVILHELLHLKYMDLWQKVFLSFIRALHWPNFLLQYVFRLIDNDMETLCDYRVMERLAGEQRRDYGRILLSMTNEKYPSAFGTTSLSNGSAFIAERIKAIARFKKYPQGMGIVSVCMVLLLAPVITVGQGTPDRLEHPNLAATGFARQVQKEQYRLARCGTVAGAIDTYAKAVFLEHSDFMEAVRPADTDVPDCRLPDTGDIFYFDTTPALYYTLNLVKHSDEKYTADIMFKNFGGKRSDDIHGTHYYIIPVAIIKQNGWKVYQTADYSHFFVNALDHTNGLPHTADYTGIINHTVHTDSGRVDVCVSNISWFNDTVNNMLAKPNTDFSQQRNYVQLFFTPDEKFSGWGVVSTGIGAVASPDRAYATSEFDTNIFSAGSRMASSGPNGNYSLESTSAADIAEHMAGISQNTLTYDSNMSALPEYLQVDIWFDGRQTEHFIIDVQAGEIYEK